MRPGTNNLAATKADRSAATTFTQTYTTTATTVPTIPADLNLGSLTLLSDAITALGTVQTYCNALQAENATNRKLINKLIDILQASGQAL